jgi:hypothetical protein
MAPSTAHWLTSEAMSASKKTRINTNIIIKTIKINGVCVWPWYDDDDAVAMAMAGAR